MKRVNRLSNKQIYVDSAIILSIANQAVQHAKEENRRLGIPEVFSKNGKLYYVLLNGELTSEPPEIFKRYKA